MKNIKNIFTICLLFLLTITLFSCEMGGGGSTSKASITFNTNGGNEIEAISGLSSGDKVTLPTPIKEGYVFLGWYLDKECLTTALPKVYTYSSAVTLYADWMLDTFNITLVSDVELSQTSYSFKYGEEIVIEEPTSDAYEFVGWYYNNEPFMMETMPAYDLELTAVWSGKDITVTLDIDGGTLDGFVSTYNIKAGETIKLLNPTKEGYIFKGWFDANSHQYTSTTPIYDSITLTAIYDDISNYESEYALNLYLNGGTLIENITKYTVGVETVLPTPERTSYEFLGWYQSEIFYGEKVTSISSITVGDIDLYAKWKEIKDQYNVVFIDEAGNETTKLVNRLSKVEAESLSDGLSWYKGNKLFDFDTLIDEDITLYANFSFLSSKLEELIPSYTSDNLTFSSKLTIGSNSVSLKYSSNDIYTLSNSGIVNPDRIDTLVTVTITFISNGISIVVPFECIVPKVVFKDLSNIKPVFAYVYANSHKGFTTTAINTIDVVNLSFGRLTSDFTVSLSDVQSHMTEIMEIRKTGTRVVLSIGGGGATLSLFSDMAYTAENRLTFTNSVLNILETYHLDGVDIDWEYPGYNTGRDVSIDRPNYTLLMATLYQKLKEANPDYLVTAALPGGRYGYERYNLAQVEQYLDYIHLMTYDMHDSTYAYHHTALYPSTNTALKANVVDSVNIFVTNGVPIEKLVIGCAFYGRVYILTGSNVTENGVGSPVSSSGSYMTYTAIHTYMLNNRGSYIYYYDSTAAAPTIYIPSENKVISFDDRNSISAKCNYVLSSGVGGIMFWENGEDTTDVLLQAINKGLK